MTGARPALSRSLRLMGLAITLGAASLLASAPASARGPDGMGLGLYYTNLVMQLNSGQLVFPGPGDHEIPEDCDGAVLGLVFKGVP